MDNQSPSAKKWPEGATIEAIEDAVERARPFAEELRGTLEAALHGAGQEWRNLDFQVAAVTNIFARAILKAREEAFEECAAYIEGKGGAIPGATVYAKVVSRNEMPSMSGDDRDRLNQWDRRAFDRATEALCRAIRGLPQKRNKP